MTTSRDTKIKKNEEKSKIYTYTHVISDHNKLIMDNMIWIRIATEVIKDNYNS